jgi:phosphoesterase RecJ-like protein
MIYKESNDIKKLIEESENIIILQADNPDADSLASALALEEILFTMGKNTFLVCGVNMPQYLHYLSGWDRVSNELPKDFDLSILVDCSAESLLESLARKNILKLIRTKPLIVLDHHITEATIEDADVICNKDVVATGELIYELSRDLKWALDIQSSEFLVNSIMSDSLGLTSEGTTHRSIEIISELVKNGVNIAKLESQRRETMKKSKRILEYKSKLIQRIEYSDDNRIATITIPWKEIEDYSSEYNPSILVMDEMRLVEGVQVVIAFKVYKDNKVTGKIRCNYGYSIADKLAECFDGGGHKYASGFKIYNVSNFEKFKNQVIAEASKLLDNIKHENI